jgi:hypothetical protein
VGTHIITASTSDNGSPALSGQDQITVTVGSPNTAPNVTITAPADGAPFNENEPITFTGTAFDAEEVPTDISSTLDWSSDLEGGLIAQDVASFTIDTLRVGTHIITASTSDNGSPALSGQDQITVTVNPTGTASFVANVDEYCGEGGRNKDKHLVSRLTITDGSVGEVANATVIATIKNWDTNETRSGSSTTDTFGQTAFPWKNAGDGNYTTTVDSVNGISLNPSDTVDVGVDWPNNNPCN